MPVRGQFWYTTEGNPSDARLVFVNDDGTSNIILFDNNPTLDLTSSFVEDVVLDTAAGLYYILVGGNQGVNAKLLVGRIGSATPPTVAFTFDPDFPGPTPGSPENNLAFGLHIDPINERLYVGFIDFVDFQDATQGVRQLTYNPMTGAVADNGIIYSQTAASIDPSAPGATPLFIPRDFDIDVGRGFMYTSQYTLGDGFETNTLVRINLNNLTQAAVSLVNPLLFLLDGNSSDFTTLNGIIQDVEVDADSDRVYFITHAEDVEESTGEDAIWLVANASTAVNATPVKLTLLNGAFAASFTTTNFYPGDIVLDEVNNILYVESENSNALGGGVGTDVILKFQLSADGLTATLIDVINPGLSGSANIEGMTFDQLAELGPLTANAAAAIEQGASVDLLTAAPLITDFESDHLNNASVAISGSFVGSGDNLTVAGTAIGAVIAGTNITVARTTDGSGNQTLRLTGYDTLTNYQNAFNLVAFNSTGDNPTNYGANISRTLTWQVNDGAAGNPSGTVNAANTNVRTTTLNITAVNDAPVNTVGAPVGGSEDGLAVAVTGISVSDVDANPATHNISVTLSVTAGSGTLFVATSVAGGLVIGDITGNNTASVVLSGTQNRINATLGALNGLIFSGASHVNGAIQLTVQTNDSGQTGTGGPLSDSDSKTINIGAVNDAPTVAGDGTETLAAVNEDALNPAGVTVASLFSGQFSDAIDNQSAFPGGSVANGFAGIAVINNAETSQGSWQWFNGAWTDITAGNIAATALLLAGSTLLRFLPGANFNGAAPALTVRLVDDSSGTVTSGATANLTGLVGGTTRYSIGTLTLDTSVTAVNDAPNVLIPAQSLTAINEDTNSAGQTVSSIFAASFSDADDSVAGGSSANNFAGVAVVGSAATSQGSWQWFNGTFWIALEGASATNAILLETSTFIRFAPAANFSGTAPALTMRLFDDSQGPIFPGVSVNLTISGTGDPTRYSATTVTADQFITPVNDAPTTGNDSSTTSEDTTYTFTLADFPFADSIDSPANNLANVIIRSLPTGGILMFDADGVGGNPAVPVTINQSIAATDIFAGKFTFVPTTNLNGAAVGSFTFQVQDDGQASFATSAQYTVGNVPVRAAVGDVNGDGQLDLVTVNNSASNVSVLAGNADGSFTPGANFAIGANAAGISLVNLNPSVDTFLDIVVGNSADNTVGVLFGNGDGTFDPQVTGANLQLAFGITTADFNADGFQDVAVARRDSAQNVSILLGSATGTFAAPLSFSTGDAGGFSLVATTIAAGDFNADGRLDMAIVNQTNAVGAFGGNVSIVLGNGDGTFGAPTQLTAGNNPTDIAVGDFNGDGRLDFAVANIVSANASVFIGNGAGGFAGAVNYALPAAGSSIAIADVDNDGKSDLIAGTNGTPGNVSILRGNGNGTFQAAYSLAGGTNVSDVVIGDFNSDSRTDIAITNSGTNDLRVFLNTSTNTSAIATQTLNVTPVNDAPTLVDASNVVLTGTPEDTTSSGATVASILAGASHDDVDTGDDSGIAITAVTGSGTWQYATDGAGWTNFGAVSAAAALLLSAATLVRYVPALDTAETATLSFRAWDQNSGTASVNGAPSTADTAVNGGISAFSGESATASLAVASVNDAPVVTASGGATGASEQVAIAVDAGLTLLDVDNVTLASATVMITANFAAGQDVLAFVNTSAALYGNIAAVYNANTGALTLTSSGASATVAEWQAALQAVSYTNTSDAPSILARTISFAASDGVSLSLAADKVVTVTGVNDAPTLTGATATLAAGTEDVAYVVSAANLLTGWTDPDGDSLSITNLTSNHGSVTDNGNGTYTVTPTVNYNGVVTLSFDVVDGNGGVMPATLNFTLTPVADPAFGLPMASIASFGSDASAGSWSSNDRYPRQVADVNGDGRADIVGFGDEHVFVSLSNGDGTSQNPIVASDLFGAAPVAGSWQYDDRYPRHLADVNGDGRADIVGFGDEHVYVALGQANGGFGAIIQASDAFGGRAGWSSDNATPRKVGSPGTELEFAL